MMRRDEPIAFVKLRREFGYELEAEALALEALARYGPTTFLVPALRTKGAFSGWHYLAVEAIPAQPHRVADQPPIQLIVREIRAALADLPRPPETPDIFVLFLRVALETFVAGAPGFDWQEVLGFLALPVAIVLLTAGLKMAQLRPTPPVRIPPKARVAGPEDTDTSPADSPAADSGP